MTIQKAGIVSFLLLSLTLAAGCFGSDLTEDGREFESALIKYEWSGVMQGEGTVYVKGAKTRSEKKILISIKGTEVEQNGVIINDGENVYKINLKNKLAIKETNQYKEEMASMSPEEKAEFRKRLVLLLEEGQALPEKQGEDVIEGKTCEIYSVLSENSTCIWNGLALRNEVVIDGGKAKQKAVSVEMNPELPDSLFQVPEDIKIQEIK